MLNVFLMVISLSLNLKSIKILMLTVNGDQDLKKAKVVKAHTSEFPIPLKAPEGAIVKGLHKPTEMKGWFYCENDDRIRGWAPQAYVKALGGVNSGRFKFLRNYDATELNVTEGTIVTINEEESGWAFVTCNDGRIGWVPLENLQILEN
jgi:hypothetical protein